MKRCLAILLVLGMLLSLTACGESGAKQEAATTDSEEAPNSLVDLVYQEGVEFLKAGQYKEAYDDFVAAAEAGSSAAMEALARGVILDQNLAEAAAGDDAVLLSLSRAFAEKGDPWGLWTAGFCCMNGKGDGIRYEEAYQLFERAAETDNEEVRGLALYEIGYMLANGYYKRDSEKALESYLAAAELGNPYAMGNLALSYAKGTLTELNHDKAIEWFKKALEVGSSTEKAWILSLVDQLGYSCLFPFDGSAPDYETGRKYYELSAEQGDQDGLFYTGVIYGQGWGVEKDSVKAISYYKKALEQGDARAAYNLAVLYTYGDDEIKQILDKGLDYFSQATDLGYEGTADLMNDVGVKILNGEGFEQNPEMAMKWCEKAAEAGSTFACNNIAYLYAYHPVKEIEQDLEKAFSAYKKSADLGDANAPENIYKVAMGLLQGKDGLKKDPETALLWFEESANRFHAPAMYMLGLMYSEKQYETVVEPDIETAIQWFELAADLGDFTSMEKLGALYSDVSSEYLDYENALLRYSEAADLCDPENKREQTLIAAHINNIGAACADEKSEDYNPDLAFRAFSKAAEFGQYEALTNLAKCYGKGLGTKADLDKANELFSRANFRGNRETFLKDSTWNRART